MKRESLEPRLVNLIAGLRRHQVQEAVALLLDYVDAACESIDGGAWYAEHQRLAYGLVFTTARASLSPPASRLFTDGGVATAQELLLAHARKISGARVPIFMAADGPQTIDYQQFADAQAKVQVLEAEVFRLRTALLAAGGAV